MCRCRRVERNSTVPAGLLPGLAAGSPTHCGAERCYTPAAIPRSIPSLLARGRRSLRSETRLETLFGNSQLPTDFSGGLTLGQFYFRLSQMSDDLFGCVSLLRHLPPFSVPLSFQTLTYPLDRFMGGSSSDKTNFAPLLRATAMAIRRGGNVSVGTRIVIGNDP